ncbi:unnamed protein product [Amoebophrya sp. A25]|nr:unnamed protein product [Amoebophrya sp. A25]|eukprot:GSA25T00001061001.1
MGRDNGKFLVDRGATVRQNIEVTQQLQDKFGSRLRTFSRSRNHSPEARDDSPNRFLEEDASLADRPQLRHVRTIAGQPRQSIETGEAQNKEARDQYEGDDFSSMSGIDQAGVKFLSSAVKALPHVPSSGRHTSNGQKIEDILKEREEQAFKNRQSRDGGKSAAAGASTSPKGRDAAGTAKSPKAAVSPPPPKKSVQIDPVPAASPTNAKKATAKQGGSAASDGKSRGVQSVAAGGAGSSSTPTGSASNKAAKSSTSGDGAATFSNSANAGASTSPTSGDASTKGNSNASSSKKVAPKASRSGSATTKGGLLGGAGKQLLGSAAGGAAASPRRAAPGLVSAGTDLAQSFKDFVDPSSETNPDFYAKFLSQTFLDFHQHGYINMAKSTAVGDVYYAHEQAKPKTETDDETGHPAANLAAGLLLGGGLGSKLGKTKGDPAAASMSALLVQKKRGSMLAFSAFGNASNKPGQAPSRDQLPPGMTYGHASGKKIKSYLPSGSYNDWRYQTGPADPPRTNVPAGSLSGGYADLQPFLVDHEANPARYPPVKGPGTSYPPRSHYDVGSPASPLFSGGEKSLGSTLSSTFLSAGTGGVTRGRERKPPRLTPLGSSPSASPKNMKKRTISAGADPASSTSPVRNKGSSSVVENTEATSPGGVRVVEADAESPGGSYFAPSPGSLSRTLTQTGWKDYLRGTSRSHLTAPIQTRAWNRPAQVNARTQRRKAVPEKELELWVALAERLLLLGSYLARDGNANKSNNCSFFMDRAELRSVLEWFLARDGFSLNDASVNTLLGSGRVPLNDIALIQDLFRKHEKALNEYRKEHPRALPESLRDTLQIPLSSPMPKELEKTLQPAPAPLAPDEPVRAATNIVGNATLNDGLSTTTSLGTSEDEIQAAVELLPLRDVTICTHFLAEMKTAKMQILQLHAEAASPKHTSSVSGAPTVTATVQSSFNTSASSSFARAGSSGAGPSGLSGPGGGLPGGAINSSTSGGGRTSGTFFSQAAPKTSLAQGNARLEMLQKLPKADRQKLVDDFLVDYIHRQQEQQRVLINLSRTLIHSPRMSRKVARRNLQPGAQAEGRMSYSDAQPGRNFDLAAIRSCVTGGRHPQPSVVASKRLLKKSRNCGKSFFGVANYGASLSDGDEDDFEQRRTSFGGVEQVDILENTTGSSVFDQTMNMSTTAGLGLQALLAYSETQELAAQHVSAPKHAALPTGHHMIRSAVDLSLDGDVSSPTSKSLASSPTASKSNMNMAGGATASSRNGADGHQHHQRRQLSLLQPLLAKAGVRDAGMNFPAGTEVSEVLLSYLRDRLLARSGNAGELQSRATRQSKSTRGNAHAMHSGSDPYYFHFDEEKKLLYHANYEYEDFGDFVFSAFQEENDYEAKVRKASEASKQESGSQADQHGADSDKQEDARMARNFSRCTCSTIGVNMPSPGSHLPRVDEDGRPESSGDSPDSPSSHPMLNASLTFTSTMFNTSSTNGLLPQQPPTPHPSAQQGPFAFVHKHQPAPPTMTKEQEARYHTEVRTELATLLQQKQKRVADTFVVAYDARNFVKHQQLQRAFAGPAPGGNNAGSPSGGGSSKRGGKNEEPENVIVVKQPRKIPNYMKPKNSARPSDSEIAAQQAQALLLAQREQEKTLFHTTDFNYGALLSPALLQSSTSIASLSTGLPPGAGSTMMSSIMSAEASAPSVFWPSALTVSDQYVRNETQFQGALEPDTHILNVRIAKILLQSDVADEIMETQRQMDKAGSASGGAAGANSAQDMARASAETKNLLGQCKEMLEEVLPRVLSVVYRRDSDDEEEDPFGAATRDDKNTNKDKASNNNGPPPLVDVSLAVWTKPPTYIIARNRMNLRARYHPEKRLLQIETHMQSLAQRRRDALERRKEMLEREHASLLAKYETKMARAWAKEANISMNPVEDNARQRKKALQRVWPVWIQLALSAKFFEDIAIPSEEEKKFLDSVREAQNKDTSDKSLMDIVKAADKIEIRPSANRGEVDRPSIQVLRAQKELGAHPLDTKIAMQRYFAENKNRQLFWLFFLAKCKLKVQLGRRRGGARICLHFLEKFGSPQYRFFFRAMNFSYQARAVQRSFRFFKFNRGCTIRVLHKQWVRVERAITGAELRRADELQERASILDEKLEEAMRRTEAALTGKKEALALATSMNSPRSSRSHGGFLPKQKTKSRREFRSAEDIRKQWHDRVTANLMSEREFLHFIIPELRYRRYHHMLRLDEYKEEVKIYTRELAKWQLKKEVYDEAKEQGMTKLPELPEPPIHPKRPDNTATHADLVDMVTRARISVDNYLRVQSDNAVEEEKAQEEHKQLQELHEIGRHRKQARAAWDILLAKQSDQWDSDFRESLNYTSALVLDDDGFESSFDKMLNDQKAGAVQMRQQRKPKPSSQSPTGARVGASGSSLGRRGSMKSSDSSVNMGGSESTGVWPPPNVTLSTHPNAVISLSSGPGMGRTVVQPQEGADGAAGDQDAPSPLSPADVPQQALIGSNLSPRQVVEKLARRSGQFKLNRFGRPKNVLFSEGKPVKGKGVDHIVEPELDFNKTFLNHQDDMLFHVYKGEPIVATDRFNAWWPTPEMLNEF